MFNVDSSLNYDSPRDKLAQSRAGSLNVSVDNMDGISGKLIKQQNYVREFSSFFESADRSSIRGSLYALDQQASRDFINSNKDRIDSLNINIGHISSGPNKMSPADQYRLESIDYLEKQGINVNTYSSINDIRRNHIKQFLRTKDNEEQGFITTGNISPLTLKETPKSKSIREDSNERYQLNVGLKLTQPSYVKELQSINDQLNANKVPDSTANIKVGPRSTQEIISQLSQATSGDRITVVSPYINDNTVGVLMAEAVSRGADVSLITSYKGAVATHQEYLDRLKASGISIITESSEDPLLIHTKGFARRTKEGQYTSFIGSSNITNPVFENESIDILAKLDSDLSKDVFDYFEALPQEYELSYRKLNRKAKAYTRAERQLASVGMLRHYKFTTRQDPSSQDVNAPIDRTLRMPYYALTMGDDYYNSFKQHEDIPYIAQFETLYTQFSGGPVTGWRRNVLKQLDSDLSKPALGQAINKNLGFDFYRPTQGILGSSLSTFGRSIDNFFGQQDYIDYKDEAKNSNYGTINSLLDIDYRQSPSSGGGFFESLLGTSYDVVQGTTIAIASYVGINLPLQHIFAQSNRALLDKLISPTGTSSKAVQEAQLMAQRVMFGPSFGNLMNLATSSAENEEQAATYIGKAHAAIVRLQQAKRSPQDILDNIDDVKLRSLLSSMIRDGKLEDLQVDSSIVLGETDELSVYKGMNAFRKLDTNRFKFIGRPILESINPYSKTKQRDLYNIYQASVNELQYTLGKAPILQYVESKAAAEGLGTENVYKFTYKNIGIQRVKELAKSMDRIGALLPVNMAYWIPGLRESLGLKDFDPAHNLNWKDIFNLEEATNRVDFAITNIKGMFGSSWQSSGKKANNLRELLGIRTSEFLATSKQAIKETGKTFKLATNLYKAGRYSQQQYVSLSEALKGVDNLDINNLPENIQEEFKKFQTSQRLLNKAYNRYNFRTQLKGYQSPASPLDIYNPTTNELRPEYVGVLTDPKAFLKARRAITDPKDMAYLRKASIRKGITLLGALVLTDAAVDFAFLRGGANLFTQVLGREALKDEEGDPLAKFKFESKAPTALVLGVGLGTGYAAGYLAPTYTSDITTQVTSKLKTNVNRLGFNYKVAWAGTIAGIMATKLLFGGATSLLNTLYNREPGTDLDPQKSVIATLLRDKTLESRDLAELTSNSSHYTYAALLEQIAMNNLDGPSGAESRVYNLASQFTLPFFQVSALGRIDTQKQTLSLGVGFQLTPVLGLGLSPMLPVSLRLRDKELTQFEEQLELNRGISLQDSLLYTTRIAGDALLGGGNLAYNNESSFKDGLLAIGTGSLLASTYNRLSNYDKGFLAKPIAKEINTLRKLGSNGLVKTATTLSYGSIRNITALPFFFGQATYRSFNNKKILPLAVGALAYTSLQTAMSAVQENERIADLIEPYNTPTTQAALAIGAAVGAYKLSGPTTRLIQTNRLPKNTKAILPYYIGLTAARVISQPGTSFAGYDVKSTQEYLEATVGLGLATGALLQYSGTFTNTSSLTSSYLNNASDKDLRNIIRSINPDLGDDLVDDIIKQRAQVTGKPKIKTPFAGNVGLQDVIASDVYEELTSKSKAYQNLNINNDYLKLNQSFRRVRGRVTLAAGALAGGYMVATALTDLTPTDLRKSIFNIPILGSSLKVLSGVDEPALLDDSGIDVGRWLSRPIPKSIREILGIYTDKPDPFFQATTLFGTSFKETGTSGYFQLASTLTDLSASSYALSFVNQQVDPRLTKLMLESRDASPNRLYHLYRGFTARQQAMTISQLARENLKYASGLTLRAIGIRQFRQENLAQQRPYELQLDLSKELIATGNKSSRVIPGGTVVNPGYTTYSGIGKGQYFIPDGQGGSVREASGGVATIAEYLNNHHYRDRFYSVAFKSRDILADIGSYLDQSNTGIGSIATVAGTALVLGSAAWTVGQAFGYVADMAREKSTYELIAEATSAKDYLNYHRYKFVTKSIENKERLVFIDLANKGNTGTVVSKYNLSSLMSPSVNTKVMTPSKFAYKVNQSYKGLLKEVGGFFDKDITEDLIEDLLNNQQGQSFNRTDYIQKKSEDLSGRLKKRLKRSLRMKITHDTRLYNIFTNDQTLDEYIDYLLESKGKMYVQGIVEEVVDTNFRYQNQIGSLNYNVKQRIRLHEAKYTAGAKSLIIDITKPVGSATTDFTAHGYSAAKHSIASRRARELARQKKLAETVYKHNTWSEGFLEETGYFTKGAVGLLGKWLGIGKPIYEAVEGLAVGSDQSNPLALRTEAFASSARSLVDTASVLALTGGLSLVGLPALAAFGTSIALMLGVEGLKQSQGDRLYQAENRFYSNLGKGLAQNPISNLLGYVLKPISFLAKELTAPFILDQLGSLETDYGPIAYTKQFLLPRTAYHKDYLRRTNNAAYVKQALTRAASSNMRPKTIHPFLSGSASSYQDQINKTKYFKSYTGGGRILSSFDMGSHGSVSNLLRLELQRRQGLYNLTVTGSMVKRLEERPTNVLGAAIGLTALAATPFILNNFLKSAAGSTLGTDIGKAKNLLSLQFVRDYYGPDPAQSLPNLPTTKYSQYVDNYFPNLKAKFATVYKNIGEAMTANADDLTEITGGSLDSLRNVKHSINNFLKASGFSSLSKAINKVGRTLPIRGAVDLGITGIDSIYNYQLLNKSRQTARYLARQAPSGFVSEATTEQQLAAARKLQIDSLLATGVTFGAQFLTANPYIALGAGLMTILASRRSSTYYGLTTTLGSLDAQQTQQGNYVAPLLNTSSAYARVSKDYSIAQRAVINSNIAKRTRSAIKATVGSLNSRIVSPTLDLLLKNKTSLRVTGGAAVLGITLTLAEHQQLKSRWRSLSSNEKANYNYDFTNYANMQRSQVLQTSTYSAVGITSLQVASKVSKLPRVKRMLNLRNLKLFGIGAGLATLGGAFTESQYLKSKWNNMPTKDKSNYGSFRNYYNTVRNQDLKLGTSIAKVAIGLGVSVKALKGGLSWRKVVAGGLALDLANNASELMKAKDKWDTSLTRDERRSTDMLTYLAKNGQYTANLTKATATAFIGMKLGLPTIKLSSRLATNLKRRTQNYFAQRMGGQVIPVDEAQRLKLPSFLDNIRLPKFLDNIKLPSTKPIRNLYRRSRIGTHKFFRAIDRRYASPALRAIANLYSRGRKGVKALLNKPAVQGIRRTMQRGIDAVNFGLRIPQLRRFTGNKLAALKSKSAIFNTKLKTVFGKRIAKYSLRNILFEALGTGLDIAQTAVGLYSISNLDKHSSKAEYQFAFSTTYAGMGSMYGAAMGTIGGPIGTLVGGIVGGIAGSIYGLHQGTRRHQRQVENKSTRDILLEDITLGSVLLGPSIQARTIGNRRYTFNDSFMDVKATPQEDLINLKQEIADYTPPQHPDTVRKAKRKAAQRAKIAKARARQAAKLEGPKSPTAPKLESPTSSTVDVLSADELDDELFGPKDINPLDKAKGVNERFSITSSKPTRPYSIDNLDIPFSYDLDTTSKFYSISEDSVVLPPNLASNNFSMVDNFEITEEYYHGKLFRQEIGPKSLRGVDKEIRNKIVLSAKQSTKKYQAAVPNATKQELQNVMRQEIQAKAYALEHIERSVGGSSPDALFSTIDSKQAHIEAEYDKMYKAARKGSSNIQGDRLYASTITTNFMTSVKSVGKKLLTGASFLFQVLDPILGSVGAYSGLQEARRAKTKEQFSEAQKRAMGSLYRSTTTQALGVATFGVGGKAATGALVVGGVGLDQLGRVVGQEQGDRIADLTTENNVSYSNVATSQLLSLGVGVIGGLAIGAAVVAALPALGLGAVATALLGVGTIGLTTLLGATATTQGSGLLAAHVGRDSANYNNATLNSLRPREILNVLSNNLSSNNKSLKHKLFIGSGDNKKTGRMVKSRDQIDSNDKSFLKSAAEFLFGAPAYAGGVPASYLDLAQESRSYYEEQLHLQQQLIIETQSREEAEKDIPWWKKGLDFVGKLFGKLRDFGADQYNRLFGPSAWWRKSEFLASVKQKAASIFGVSDDQDRYKAQIAEARKVSRQIGNVFGLSVGNQGKLGEGIFSEPDRELLAMMIAAESESEGYLGQRLVAASIVNRVALIKSGKASAGTYGLADQNRVKREINRLNALGGRQIEYTGSVVQQVLFGDKQYQPVRNNKLVTFSTEDNLQRGYIALVSSFDRDRLRQDLMSAGYSEAKAKQLTEARSFRTNNLRLNIGWFRPIGSYKNHTFGTDDITKRVNAENIVNRLFKVDKDTKQKEPTFNPEQLEQLISNRLGKASIEGGYTKTDVKTIRDGGGAAFHIDMMFMSNVSEQERVQLFDQMAQGYKDADRRIEFSNNTVSSLVYNLEDSYEEKASLLRKVVRAHSHSRRPAMDFYVPKIGSDRFFNGSKGTSAEGANVNYIIPTLPGGYYTVGPKGRSGQHIQGFDSNGRRVYEYFHGGGMTPGKYNFEANTNTLSWKDGDILTPALKEDLLERLNIDSKTKQKISKQIDEYNSNLPDVEQAKLKKIVSNEVKDPYEGFGDKIFGLPENKIEKPTLSLGKTNLPGSSVVFPVAGKKREDFKLSRGAMFHAWRNRAGGRSGLHYGEDYAIGQGSSLVALRDGEIVAVNFDGSTSFGFVTLKYKRNGRVEYAQYGHISKPEVKVGEKVIAGQEIAKSGGRPGTPGYGSGTGPHLDIKFYTGSPRNKKYFDPHAEGLWKNNINSKEAHKLRQAEEPDLDTNYKYMNSPKRFHRWINQGPKGRKHIPTKIAFSAGHFDRTSKAKGWTGAPGERQWNIKVGKALSRLAKRLGIEAVYIDENQTRKMTLGQVGDTLRSYEDKGYYAFEIHADRNDKLGRSGMIAGNLIEQGDISLAKEFGSYNNPRHKTFGLPRRNVGLLETASMHEVNALNNQQQLEMADEVALRVLRALFPDKVKEYTKKKERTVSQLNDIPVDTYTKEELAKKFRADDSVLSDEELTTLTAKTQEAKRVLAYANNKAKQVKEESSVPAIVLPPSANVYTGVEDTIRKPRIEGEKQVEELVIDNLDKTVVKISTPQEFIYASLAINDTIDHSDVAYNDTISRVTPE